MHALKKFKELLGDIFQFESSDLDFGIYRILNYKQKEVKEFIYQKLPQIIENAFQKHKKNLSENIHEEYERVRREIIRTLGNNAFTPTGELNPVFADTNIGQEYLRIKEQKELLEKLEEIKEQVYNDLYSFFSRFYEDGDFIPQYRYSKEPKYCIPYNGEEVKLYWANADQYYIKTGILFRDYTFKAGNKKVIFRTVSAREEINGNKATKDRIKEWAGEEFYREVLKKVLQNNKQLEEWERLGFGKFEREEDLEGKKLPIDTRYFEERFKWELLERISERVNLDDALDGLLIKSENWQALNTILNRYKEKVQTIYIDPPFNKEQDADYLYNVKYKDSTWISMLENRLRLAKELLNERGSIWWK